MNKRLAAWLCLAALVVVFVPVGIWWSKFGLGFSQAPENWAYFATYVSGLALPILTVGSVIGILFTLLEQKRGNGEQSKANAQAEADRLKSARLADTIEDKKDKRHKDQITADIQMECTRRVILIADRLHEAFTSQGKFTPTRDLTYATFLFLTQCRIEVASLKHSIPADLRSYPESMQQLIGASLNCAITLLNTICNNHQRDTFLDTDKVAKNLKVESDYLRNKYDWLIQNSNP